MDKSPNLQEVVLETLSFYEPMIIEKIVWQLDTEKFPKDQQPTFDQLDQILKDLEKLGLVKKCDSEKDMTWLKTTPKERRSLTFKFKLLIKKIF